VRAVQPKLRWSDLWRWDGTIDRGPYLLVGCILLAVKYNLDRAITFSITGRAWGLVDLAGFADYLLRRADYAANPTLEQFNK
jgi:hypothetical protein